MNRVDAYWTFVESRRVGLISFIGEGGLEAVKEVKRDTMKCFEKIVVTAACDWCENNKIDLRFVYEFRNPKEKDLHCMKAKVCG